MILNLLHFAKLKWLAMETRFVWKVYMIENYFWMYHAPETNSSIDVNSGSAWNAF